MLRQLDCRINAHARPLINRDFCHLSRSTEAREAISAMLPRRLNEELLYARAVSAMQLAQPIKSAFKVGAAALIRDAANHRYIISGYNTEYVNNDSTHAEESLTSKLRPGDRLELVTVVGQNGEPLTPCGNCRELLSSWATDRAEVLVTKREEQTVWQPLHVLLPKALPNTHNLADLPHQQQELLLAAKAIMAGAYIPYSGEAKGAAIMTANGLLIVGSPREDAAYHNIHALEAVLVQSEVLRERDIKEICLVGSGEYGLPYMPCGRCLQKVYEAAQICGRERSLVVLLMNPRNHLVWQTTIDQLLPLPFGPKDLGIDVGRFLV
ncbi:hypothetical protein A2311_01760 [candidate division WOR-1 bacterium RIFOXYB2_FULL_48_7]|uniref:CMP/dCMP-type deaminase domain-containing protein n=1 Tax=candidate division WOR-1 bacterium RIFOXYB2_FULL_48_7 TaxID=1802583 RepID=A0A1F4TDY4_UNCSA|nr:MAG: hypothetical protein A2311_01760 [candidate division WOR-1 bacterium RIFOXYB2_FULL_48_7]